MARAPHIDGVVFDSDRRDVDPELREPPARKRELLGGGTSQGVVSF